MQDYKIGCGKNNIFANSKLLKKIVHRQAYALDWQHAYNLLIEGWHEQDAKVLAPIFHNRPSCLIYHFL